MGNHALKMYHYHIWANEVIINRLKELPQELYHKEIQSGFSSISKVLTHIYIVDCLWFDIIIGNNRNEAFAKAEQSKEQLETKDIEELDTKFVKLSEDYIVYLNQQEDLERVIVVDNPYAGKLETSLTETLIHVVTHGSYHRGNIATMIRKMGFTSVMQDYGLYLYSNSK